MSDVYGSSTHVEQEKGCPYQALATPRGVSKSPLCCSIPPSQGYRNSFACLTQNSRMQCQFSSLCESVFQAGCNSTWQIAKLDFLSGDFNLCGLFQVQSGFMFPLPVFFSPPPPPPPQGKRGVLRSAVMHVQLLDLQPVLLRSAVSHIQLLDLQPVLLRSAVSHVQLLDLQPVLLRSAVSHVQLWIFSL